MDFKAKKDSYLEFGSVEPKNLKKNLANFFPRFESLRFHSVRIMFGSFILIKFLNILMLLK